VVLTVQDVDGNPVFTATKTGVDLAAAEEKTLIFQWDSPQLPQLGQYFAVAWRVRRVPRFSSGAGRQTCWCSGTWITISQGRCRCSATDEGVRPAASAWLASAPWQPVGVSLTHRMCLLTRADRRYSHEKRGRQTNSLIPMMVDDPKFSESGLADALIERHEFKEDYFLTGR